MSRHREPLTEHIQIITGSDHVIGNFIQVQDGRFRESGNDMQGEGYVFECDSMFGITLNLIEAKQENIPISVEKIIELCNQAAANNYEKTHH